MLNTKQICDVTVKRMQEKKAEEIVIINLKGKQNTIADYHVICNGSSSTQIDAISDDIIEFLKTHHNIRPFSSEGKQNKEWIITDYIDTVVHVFNREKRVFFDLENLWGDVKIIRV